MSDTDTIKKNKELTEKYPFLLPDVVDYDYSYTLLDLMPDGWCKAFGEALVVDIYAQLLKEGTLSSYRILDIKEKYGELRWIGNLESEELRLILNKYADMSSHTCIVCGNPAEYTLTDWICPVCDKCKQKFQ